MVVPCRQRDGRMGRMSRGAVIEFAAQVNQLHVAAPTARVFPHDGGRLVPLQYAPQCVGRAKARLRRARANILAKWRARFALPALRFTHGLISPAARGTQSANSGKNVTSTPIASMAG